MSKALLFHGGGPTAVLNSSLSGALELLQEAGVQTDGALCGIAHVLDGRIRTIGRLDGQALEKLSRSPGSALGSGRDHLEPEDYHTIAGTLARLGYEYVIAAGGNGTMDTTVRLAEACARYGIKVTGIPKTMDNDLSGTDHSPGFISAALYMAASCREALYDLNGLPIHVVVIEAFGRNAGWIAASSCLAGTPEVEGPDLILLPEDDFDEDAFLSRVEVDDVAGRHSQLLVDGHRNLQRSHRQPDRVCPGTISGSYRNRYRKQHLRLHPRPCLRRLSGKGVRMHF